MKNAITIAGSDPTSGAGAQADLRVFAELKMRGFSALTAVTAQDGKKVHALLGVPASLVKKQVEVVLDRFLVDAVKIGMLATEENVKAVKGLIKKYGLMNVVLDPVLVASSGKALLEKKALPALRGLLRHVKVVTPNLAEAEALTGIKVTTVKRMIEAADVLRDMGAANALITGGHLKGDPVDVLYDGRGLYELAGTRLKGGPFHGTGCLLSTSLAVGLAKGRSVRGAAMEAKEYTVKALKKMGGHK